MSVPLSSSEPADPAGKPSFSLFLRRRGVAIRILAASCLFFLLSTCLIAYISLKSQEEAFFRYANSKCVALNTLMAYVLNGDQLERFSRQLSMTPEYADFVKQLDAIYAKAGAKYLYILFDNKVPGQYTYLYDSEQSMELGQGRYKLGINESMDQYAGAAEVLATNKPFTTARYYHQQPYGELYYAYAPIVNSAGKVVAFVGTDVDITPLRALSKEYMWRVAITFAVAFTLFFSACLLMIRRLYTRPMQAVTRGAMQLARGESHLSIPESVLQQTDEVGGVAQAVAKAHSQLTRLDSAMHDALIALCEGHLKTRVDISGHRGLFRQILVNLHRNSDVLCEYFDRLPCAVVFMNREGELQYSNLTAETFAVRHKLDDSTNFVRQVLKDAVIRSSSSSECVQSLEEIRWNRLAEGQDLVSWSGQLRLQSETSMRVYEVLLQTCPQLGNVTDKTEQILSGLRTGKTRIKETRIMDADRDTVHSDTARSADTGRMHPHTHGACIMLVLTDVTDCLRAPMDD